MGGCNSWIGVDQAGGRLGASFASDRGGIRVVTVRTILLRTFGLKANEVNVVKSVCTLSTHAARAHALRIAASGEAPDICVVDGDDAEAHAHWRYWQDQRGGSAILVTVDPARSSPGARTLRRPMLASRLLAMLDEIAITVPRSGPATIKAVRGPAPATDGSSAPRRGRALVVDDSPTVRKQIEIVLREMGFEVVTAVSGETALDCVSQQDFDLILLDVVLPGTDGYQVCKAIKRDLETKRTPVVMLTGKSSPFDRIRGSLAGCDTYLTKPVNRAEFEAVVYRYARAHASPIEAALAGAPARAAGS